MIHDPSYEKILFYIIQTNLKEAYHDMCPIVDRTKQWGKNGAGMQNHLPSSSSSFQEQIDLEFVRLHHDKLKRHESGILIVIL